MKNRGFLTRPTISPLGTHKDQAPADLPNQQVANLTAKLTHKDAIVPDRRPPQPNSPVEESGLPLRATASPVPTAAPKRYTLIVKLDAGLHQRLEVSLERLGPSARSAAKRAMLLAFRSHVVSIPMNGAPTATPVDAVSYRIDIRLPDATVGQLLDSAGQTAFEPRATALARSLALHFREFVREALGPASSTASANRVAEPTKARSRVHR